MCLYKTTTICHLLFVIQDTETDKVTVERRSKPSKVQWIWIKKTILRELLLAGLLSILTWTFQGCFLKEPSRTSTSSTLSLVQLESFFFSVFHHFYLNLLLFLLFQLFLHCFQWIQKIWQSRFYFNLTSWKPNFPRRPATLHAWSKRRHQLTRTAIHLVPRRLAFVVWLPVGPGQEESRNASFHQQLFTSSDKEQTWVRVLKGWEMEAGRSVDTGGPCVGWRGAVKMAASSCQQSTCSSCLAAPLVSSLPLPPPQIVLCLLPVGVLSILCPPLRLPLDTFNVLPVPKPRELSCSYLKGIWWLCHGEFVLWKSVFFLL